MAPSRGKPLRDEQSGVCETPEQLSTPDEPPPSCHPALLRDDEYRAIHLALQTRDFHRELCHRLEKVVRQANATVGTRKRKRDSDAASDTSSPSSALQRSDTQDSLSSISSAGTVSTQPSDASSKRFRWSDDADLTPLSSVSPHSVDEPVKATDLSWWRALTPTPPDSPRLGPTSTYGHTRCIGELLGCG